MAEIFDSEGRPIAVIKNSSGSVLVTLEGADVAFDDLDLTDAQLEGITAEGLICQGAIFVRANLRRADLYWIIAFLADFTDANLEGAQLMGGDLKETKFIRANLKSANLGRSNVGGPTKLQGADLMDAKVDDAIFDGAEYDRNTRFPSGFDPIRAGMTEIASDYD